MNKKDRHTFRARRQLMGKSILNSAETKSNCRGSGRVYRKQPIQQEEMASAMSGNSIYDLPLLLLCNEERTNGEIPKSE